MNVKKVPFAAAGILALAVLSASMSFAPEVAATTLLRMSLAQMSAAADTIIRGRCVATSARWEDGAIWTFADVEVIEAIKGSPYPRIQVRIPGGHIGNLATHIEAAPRIEAGEERILFLEKSFLGGYGVTAWSEGAFRVRRNVAGEELVTQDSSAFAVFDAITRQFHVEGIRDLPLSELRRRLAIALAQPTLGRSR